MLANLLTNAIKYSFEGGAVRVTLRAMDGPDGKSALLVVRDEGSPGEGFTRPGAGRAPRTLTATTTAGRNR